ncbi:MAG TPA: phage tail family protein [bacterium]|nr:phage tail family protein [bacterium]
MIRIGTFLFPEDSSWWRSATMEALSKERREIVIEAILSDPDNPIALRRQIEIFEQEVERLDRGEAVLCLHPGRFFEGRRRELSVVPSPREDAARISLKVLTIDRFERSDVLHRLNADISPPGNSLYILNRGNHLTPPLFQVQPEEAMTGFRIDIGAEVLNYSGSLNSGDILTIDCERGIALLNSEENVTNLVDEFPRLSSGWSTVTLHSEATVDGAWEIQYRDLWV